MYENKSKTGPVQRTTNKCLIAGRKIPLVSLTPKLQKRKLNLLANLHKKFTHDFGNLCKLPKLGKSKVFYAKKWLRQLSLDVKGMFDVK